MRGLSLALAFALPVGAGAVEQGDPVAGEAVWQTCAACHQIGADAESRVGPELNDIVGRPAGAVEGFRYSNALIAAAENGLVWDAETLDAFLAHPRGFLKGTRMSFRGIENEKDRRDLVAFLGTADDEVPGAPGFEVDEAILAIVGDPAFGEYLSSECTACHQRSGGDDGIPGIVGWDTRDFVAAMHAYKVGARAHPVMQMMAGRLSNEEIAALAAYFENAN